VSVDRRGDGSFRSNAHRAFPLLDAFAEARWDVRLLNVNQPLEAVRAAARDAVVFVLADTFAGDSPGSRRWPQPHGFRSFLAAASLRFVGSGYRGVSRSSSGSKATARRVLASADIAVPDGTVLRRGRDRDLASLAGACAFPVVVKQVAGTGGGVGVHLVRSAVDLRDVVRWHWEVRDQDVVVEEFVDGREFSLWVVERRGEAADYGVIEIRKPAGEPILDQGAKIRSRFVEAFSASPSHPEGRIDPPLPRSVTRPIREAALAAHRACGLRQYSRVDLIVRDRIAYVLDVNACPEVTEAGLGAVARARGETLASLLARLAKEVVR
jgi:D-alanine-D-alanine ligase-like ATP-grasp enzyme